MWTDRRMDKQTKNGQTNRWNFTNFERNLAVMVIYVPVKLNSIGQTVFVLESGNEKCEQTDRQRDVGHINLIGGLVTRNPPKKWMSRQRSNSCRTHGHSTQVIHGVIMHSSKSLITCGATEARVLVECYFCLHEYQMLQLYVNFLTIHYSNIYSIYSHLSF